MKKKHHIKKNPILIQLSDGSVFKLNVFSKNSLLKLNIDLKSSVLWKINIQKINKNYKTTFFKKFNYLIN